MECLDLKDVRISKQAVSGIPLNMLSSEPLPSWITGNIESPVGGISRAATTWDRQDCRGEFKARISNRFRMKCAIKPGLLAVGDPTSESPVLFGQL